MSALFEELDRFLHTLSHRSLIRLQIGPVPARLQAYQDDPIPVFDLFNETTMPFDILIDPVVAFASDPDTLVNATFN